MNLKAIYLMILTSPKPIKKIIEGYNIVMPYSEIHTALIYIEKSMSKFNYEEARVTLNENMDFLHKHLI